MKGLAQLSSAIARRDGDQLSKMAEGAQPERVLNDDQIALVNMLFVRLRAIFPASEATAFKTAEAEAATKQEWLRAFARNGINTREQLRAGLNIAGDSTSPFWPSPGQFVSWCKSGELSAAGLPSIDQVMTELKRYENTGYLSESPEAYDWPSDAYYWIILDMRSEMRQRNLNASDVRKLGERIIASWGSKILSGNPIPKPVVRIESGARRDRSDADREAMRVKGLERVRAMKQAIEASKK